MDEKEFRDVIKSLMGIHNLEGKEAFEAELASVNSRAAKRGQRVEFLGALYAGLFTLRDTRTNKTIFEYRLGNILNWTNSPLRDLFRR